MAASSGTSISGSVRGPGGGSILFTAQRVGDPKASMARNTTANAGAPARVLTLKDAIFLAVGIVVGAGIFKAPSLVAGNTSSGFRMIAALGAGRRHLDGRRAVLRRACACAFPSAGGDYHFLARAFGKRLAFLFAWARITVIATGSIALLAFVFGDYCSQILPLARARPYFPTLYAAFIIVALTGINYLGHAAKRDGAELAHQRRSAPGHWWWWSPPRFSDRARLPAAGGRAGGRSISAASALPW